MGDEPLRRVLLMFTVAGCIAGGASLAVHTASADLTAPTLPPISADALTARYAANRTYVADAQAAARRMGDNNRADVYARFAGRDFLEFSPVNEGQVVEVLGDLAHAERIALVVPGSDTTVDTYDFFGNQYAALGGAARNLYAETHALAPRTAVIAWFGYEAPRTQSVDVLTTSHAEQGGERLAALLNDLHRMNGDARIALVCHSYGSVVCANTLHRLPPGTESVVTGAAVVGSPGMGVPTLAAIGTRVPVWIGRGTNDWIRLVPHLDVPLLGTTLGFGPDPTTPEFGARKLPVGASAHGEYFKDGTFALHNIALVAVGETPAGSGG